MIEADFQREYQIDLTKEMNTLTWRRFLVLLGGLGMNSTLINVLRQSTPKAPAGNVIDDPEKAEKAFLRAMGGVKAGT